MVLMINIKYLFFVIFILQEVSGKDELQRKISRKLHNKKLIIKEKTL